MYALPSDPFAAAAPLPRVARVTSRASSLWSLVRAERIDLSASSVPALERIASAARREGRAARVHLEADTGMARGGASTSEQPGLMSAASQVIRIS